MNRNFFKLIFTGILIWPLCTFAQDTITPSHDSYIYQAGEKADSIYGLLNPNELIVRQSVASAQWTRNAYIKFDIDDHPGPFSNASIKLFGNVLDEKQVDIYYCDTSWTEETLTGNNRPPGTILNSTLVEIGEGYASWDVTTYVNEARSAGQHKVSFVIMDVAGAVSTEDTEWHSKENTSGKGPRLILTPGDPPEELFGSYYIDQVNGSDDSTGRSPEQAWKSLANISNIVLQPGDSLLFKSGCEWTGTFSPKGSGLPGQPVVIGKYGGEERPLIDGGGLGTNTISFNNQHHIELRDLAISNKGTVEEFRRGVYYHASDMGEIRSIVFDNLEVFDVNGIYSKEDSKTKNNGGIFLEITGSGVPTWFDTLVVSNCYIHDLNRTGLSNQSSWSKRTLNENENWTPSQNVHIHHNTFHMTGANALIVRVSHHPIMEYNLFDSCSYIGTGNASFSFNTDSAIWQYNEARYTVYNEGENDAGGLDSDFRAKHTIIQYNYVHGCGYSGILLTGGPGSGTGFNDGTIVRYNVFANNNHHTVRTSGNLTNSKIYNNVFYVGPDIENSEIIWHKSWGGSLSDGTYYWNNIFYNEGTNNEFHLGTSTNNEFENNIYSGDPFINRPEDDFADTENTRIINQRGGPDGYVNFFHY